MSAGRWTKRLLAGAAVATAIAASSSVASAATVGPCRGGAVALLVCSVPGAAGAVVLDDAPLAQEAIAAAPQVASVAGADTTSARAPVLPLIITVPPVRPRPSRPVVSRGVAPKTWKAPAATTALKAPATPRRPARR